MKREPVSSLPDPERIPWAWGLWHSGIVWGKLSPDPQPNFKTVVTASLRYASDKHMCAANGGDCAAHTHTHKAFIQAPHPLRAGTWGQDHAYGVGPGKGPE